MTANSYYAVAEKIFSDLELAMKKDVTINEFDVVPVMEADNKNSSPVLKGECTLGLESWIIPHIYPYAHHQVMQKSNYKSQNVEKLMPYLLGVALLNPDMPVAWSHRRELIKSKKLSIDNELRLSRMALSRKPKCNEALAHRRWVIMEMGKEVQDKSNLLREELLLSEMIANRYHSNYHAWSHRMWSMQQLLPGDSQRQLKRDPSRNLFLELPNINSPEFHSRVVSKTDYSSIVSSGTLQAYWDELENSMKWISSHVSDHSGLHYRAFLISETVAFFRNSVYCNNKMELEGESSSQTSAITNIQCTEGASSYDERRWIVMEFLKSFEFDNYYKRIIHEYVAGLENGLTLFDILISIFILELKSNNTLCSMFSGHEALWYYRRFLIFSFRHCLHSSSTRNGTNDVKVCSHQDRNGVPRRKDLKYDYDLKVEEERILLDGKSSNAFSIFYTVMLHNEEDTIRSGLISLDENAKRVVQNYSRWFKQCIKNEKS